ncbi:MAG: excinuclease ABC subunit UvrC [Bacteroidales bacterium]|jgi:excinuclease ABC subunit C|nr:excinuclease ABC subunit UvrC [Bacteroidales bacterium]
MRDKGKESKGVDEYLRGIVSSLPDLPGVYQYLNDQGVVIYVGKAKNLKRRVSSYFNKDVPSPKTRVMVRHIADLKYIVVESEEDALLLENNLIKQYKPHYNVLLKDDKTYPWICIKKERFPRVFSTRQFIRDGSVYFGPYSSVFMVKTMLELIAEIYPLRNCALKLDSEEIARNKYKVCLQYHIKKCGGPCMGLQSESDYVKNIAEIHEIVKGDVAVLISRLYQEMTALSNEYRYEEAQKVKQKYQILENYRCKSTIVSSIINDVDVFSFDEEGASGYLNFLHVVRGAIVQAYTFEYKRRLDETKEELLSLGIAEMRQRFKSTASEIIVPFPVELELRGVRFTIPQRGERKQLLELSLRNVKQYKLDILKRAEKLNPEQRMTRVLLRLQKDLDLKELPLHIECFDNSNIQGSYPVASCVVFKNAKPSKKEYRHFNIKTVEGPNDFASMEEILTRRYTRLMNEETPLPQLVIVDGGKGQLSSACAALQRIGAFDKMSVIGIAKRLEEIYFPRDSTPVYLDKNSESLRLIQQLRDEAHRFGITFHRKKRSKGQVLSELDGVKGIGKKTKGLLLEQFKSVKRIKSASREELEALIGVKKTSVLLAGLRSEK